MEEKLEPSVGQNIFMKVIGSAQKLLSHRARIGKFDHKSIFFPAIFAPQIMYDTTIIPEVSNESGAACINVNISSRYDWCKIIYHLILNTLQYNNNIFLLQL